MRISELLVVPKGITAIIGSGGKTTLMETLARELDGSVIMTTTTKIMTPRDFRTLLSPTAEEIASALRKDKAVCVGTVFEGEKLAAPPISCEEMAEIAEYVLVEADGARMLPLKAHAAHEPVIPRGCARTILVIGVDGFGKPIGQTCHRPERYAEIAGTTPDSVVTPVIAAKVILAEKLGDCIYINKVETEEQARFARKLTALVPGRAVSGSLRKGEYALCRL